VRQFVRDRKPPTRRGTRLVDQDNAAAPVRVGDQPTLEPFGFEGLDVGDVELSAKLLDRDGNRQIRLRLEDERDKLFRRAGIRQVHS
jgi:hypothetical protein